jgi:hypothetical protein
VLGLLTIRSVTAILFVIQESSCSVDVSLTKEQEDKDMDSAILLSEGEREVIAVCGTDNMIMY